MGTLLDQQSVQHAPTRNQATRISRLAPLPLPVPGSVCQGGWYQAVCVRGVGRESGPKPPHSVFHVPIKIQVCMTDIKDLRHIKRNSFQAHCMHTIFIVLIAAHIPSAAAQLANKYYSSTGTFTSNCAISDCYVCPTGQWNSVCGAPGAAGITAGSSSTCTSCTNAAEAGSPVMSYTYTSTGGWQNNCTFSCNSGFVWDTVNKKCISTTCSPPQGAELLTNSNSASGCTWICVAGYWASDTSSTAATCTSCAAGYFSSVRGATTCSACSSGTYTTSTGFSVCSSCQSFADVTCGLGRYTYGCGGTSPGTCATCNNSPS